MSSARNLAAEHLERNPYTDDTQEKQTNEGAQCEDARRSSVVRRRCPCAVFVCV